MSIFEQGKVTVVFRSDRCSAFAIVEHADFTEVIAINQILDRLILFSLRVDMIDPDVNRELAIANEEHKSFSINVDCIAFLTVDNDHVGGIFLLQVDHVGASENTLQFLNKLSDTFVFLETFLHLEFSYRHVLAALVHLELDMLLHERV